MAYYGRCRCNKFFNIINQMKNTITNIIGMLVFALGVYMFTFQGMETLKFILLIIVGGVLVYFDNKGIKRLVKKGITKYI